MSSSLTSWSAPSLLRIFVTSFFVSFHAVPLLRVGWRQTPVAFSITSCQLSLSAGLVMPRMLALCRRLESFALTDCNSPSVPILLSPLFCPMARAALSENVCHGHYESAYTRGHLDTTQRVSAVRRHYSHQIWRYCHIIDFALGKCRVCAL